MNDLGYVILGIIVATALIFVFGFNIGRNIGYEQGQIDAINGKIYYHIQRQDDGSSTWVKCPDVCEAK